MELPPKPQVWFLGFNKTHNSSVHLTLPRIPYGITVYANTRQKQTGCEYSHFLSCLTKSKAQGKPIAHLLCVSGPTAPIHYILWRSFHSLLKRFSFSRCFRQSFSLTSKCSGIQCCYLTNVGKYSTGPVPLILMHKVHTALTRKHHDSIFHK